MDKQWMEINQEMLMVKELLIFNLCFGVRIGLRMGHGITAGLHILSYQQYSVLNVQSLNSIFEYLKFKAA